ncbi:MAG: endonuclease MutS2 [Bdellovibrionaceae bacterium]|jgi:DNA mismatch repair protein MutS2|nr:endonuclease MutS2 [Pseudobdellovibrionaceae bacterium]
MTKDLINIDWPEVAKHLSKFATCGPAKDHLATLAPCESQKQAENSFIQIEQAYTMVKEFRPRMESLDLYPVWASRVQKKMVLKSIDFKDIRLFLLDILECKEALENLNQPWAKNRLHNLFNSKDALAYIEQIFNEDGTVRTDASEELYKLHQEQKRIENNIQKTLDQLVKKHELDNIRQDKYVTLRQGRWVIPIISSFQGQFQGVRHASSHSKQTAFMEPDEVIPLNNRLNEINYLIEEEIERILRQISYFFHGEKAKLALANEQLLELDILFAKAQFAISINANPVQFSKEEIILKQLTHPKMVINKENPVANTIELNAKQRILLLSGPNAGGKTVLLKSISLAAHMARCGLYVCADTGSRLPFFNALHVAIGDLQSVDNQLSTFAAHLKVLNSSLNTKGLQEIIFIDEICGSTEPEEGAALARSFIQSYLDNNIFAVLTSHLNPLKHNWDKESGLINGSMEYDNKTNTPLFQIILGIPGESLAIKTAQRVGVDKNIIDRAISYLSPELKNHFKNYEQIESLKEDLLKIKAKYNNSIHEQSKAQKKYEESLETLEKDKEQILFKVKAKAEDQLQEMLQRERVKDTFKKFDHFENTKALIPKVIKSRNTASNIADDKEDFKKRFCPGTPVNIPTLNKSGVIQSPLNSKGDVTILCDTIRLSVHWRLCELKENISPNAKRIQDQKRNQRVLYSAGSTNLNLRGKNVDEALTELEVSLDRAAMDNTAQLKVVHGHGTDTLKKAIRSYLSRSAYVSSWKPGHSNEGGDGITVVDIHTSL